MSVGQYCIKSQSEDNTEENSYVNIVISRYNLDVLNTGLNFRTNYTTRCEVNCEGNEFSYFRLEGEQRYI